MNPNPQDNEPIRPASTAATTPPPRDGTNATNATNATDGKDETNLTTSEPTGAGTSKRGSSTESEYGRRTSRRRSTSDGEEEEEEDNEDEEEDDDENMEEEDSAGESRASSHRSSQSTQHRSSSSGGSPLRRLPPVLRPPTSHQGPPSSSTATVNEVTTPTGYGERREGYEVYTPPSGAPPSRYANAYASGSPSMPRNHAHPYYPSTSTAMSEAMDRYMSSRGGVTATQASPRDTPALAASMDARPGQKRRLSQTEYHPSSQASVASSSRGYEHPGSSNTSTRGGDMNGSRGQEDGTDPLRFETRGSHGPRDESRYETWTSKQLRKKCSHLKLRGLKNVKKHVMVEALYRYYRNMRQRDAAENAATTNNPNATSSANKTSDNRPSAMASTTGSIVSASSRQTSAYKPQYERGSASLPPTSNYGNSHGNSQNGIIRGRSSSSTSSQSVGSGHVSARKGASVSANSNHEGMMRSGGPGGYYRSSMEDESKMDALDNEVRITSEDVIRLVDVILSPEFVDRLANELSRWQFWVDVREKFIALLNAHTPSSYGAVRGLTALSNDGRGSDSMSRVSLTSYSRSTKWSSMQLWEMWKELTFAYTKTCFEFTAAGMTSADERDYIQFCHGRPDVFYLHQRLHARPDLLHLIKSNEYIEEKNTNETESLHAEKNAANVLLGVSSPSQRSHKRFKRIVPAANQTSFPPTARGESASPMVRGAQGPATGGTTNPRTVTSNTAVNAVIGGGSTANSASVGAGGSRSAGGGQYGGTGVMTNGNSPPGQEEGSTENSETTGEDASLEKSNTNSSSSLESTRREALAEQKYFGLLLQNFEAIFESLHNKKVLLAALRKDQNAPDHLISDLHDDIHVLSALKKEFRNKLRQTLE
ncbi:hypothetical protein Poli38472_013267 [Pythium oligandrum]|uniref:Uncharacterized protein n=1 Tax=Pythium oligandrum TaxID=41045 RepID=A0A8K1C2Q9_PYTOL|nr:hypothetical protein Poli38472_013267 [Pythium oligandrum]|eukprot:TMW55376.1 hypothetical protein Poli38472_013267 [Pythium oligandrum]